MRKERSSLYTNGKCKRAEDGGNQTKVLIGGHAGWKEKGYALTRKMTRNVGDVRRSVVATLDDLEHLCLSQGEHTCLRSLYARSDATTELVCHGQTCQPGSIDVPESGILNATSTYTGSRISVHWILNLPGVRTLISGKKKYGFSCA